MDRDRAMQQGRLDHDGPRDLPATRTFSTRASLGTRSVSLDLIAEHPVGNLGLTLLTGIAISNSLPIN